MNLIYVFFKWEHVRRQNRYKGHSKRICFVWFKIEWLARLARYTQINTSYVTGKEAGVVYVYEFYYGEGLIYEY